MVYKKFGKRFIGVLLSLMGLIVCFIPMLVIAVLIKSTSRGPVIFKQERLGRNEHPFTIYKFRTMIDHAYEKGGLVIRSDDSRITKVGAVLRRTSLDELPQMINILKGNMAIIGPRPILPWEFDEYRDNLLYCKRYDVLPGLFCTVDIDLRAAADRDTQFKMDSDYAENVTFPNDCHIFWSVLKTVLSGKNVYREEIDNNRVHDNQ